MANKKQEVIDIIKEMSVLELSELVKELEELFGVTAAAPVAVAAAAGPAEAAEEQTEFTVMLTDSGAKKIQVIKAVREITKLGLKEAKDLVDTLPSEVSKDIPKDEAEAIKAKLEAAGGKAEIK